MKDERVFTTRDEMVLTIFSDICRSLSYIGSKPLRPTDLVVDPEAAGIRSPGIAMSIRYL
jgi:hypothetical protein